MNQQTEKLSTVTREQVAKGLGKTAFAFRGYNATNLGRTPELLRHPQYGPIVAKYLQRASDICTDVMKFPVDRQFPEAEKNIQLESEVSDEPK